MKFIVAAVIMLSMTSVAVCQILRNVRMKGLCERRLKIPVYVLLCGLSVLVSDVAASEARLSMYGLAMDLMPSVVAMWILSSSFAEENMTKWTVRLMLLADMLLLIFNLCRMIGFADAVRDGVAVILASAPAAFMMLLFVCSLIGRMGNVKSVMRNGTVWAFVCLAVDSAYLCFVLAALALVHVGPVYAGVLLLCGTVCAIGIRQLTDSEFVICRNRERIIIESIKITSVQSASDGTRIEDVYKDLYERVITYFETKRPYLDNALTINQIAKDLYSNKLYVSRAISQFTGRNFCQFVNYYRVVHAMECFRENPELKVYELTELSGFNSIVSFNMAFRLFMGENPSEWCRKERSRLMKSGK